MKGRLIYKGSKERNPRKKNETNRAFKYQRNVEIGNNDGVQEGKERTYGLFEGFHSFIFEALETYFELRSGFQLAC
jgi:hypothetical protein